MMMHRLLILTASTAAMSCVGPGLLTDGTTVSVGNHATGALRHGTRIPFRGEGYVMPQRWRERQRNHGTDELVQLLVRAARRVNRVQRSSLLGVADLSAQGGGSTPEHRSHRSGRDVDLLYYMCDAEGKPLPPTEMIYLDRQGDERLPTSQPAAAVAATGRARLKADRRRPAAPLASLPAQRKLDVPRTWEMVKVLITDPETPVQWIFIGEPIAKLLLQHARRKREPAYLLERAAAVMHQPSDAQTHMDHWHLRIFCSPSDRYQGCIDRGPSRWMKKELKYVDSPVEPTPLPSGLARLTLQPLRIVGL
jgi:penicillin-insensitive murein DD-endopeptidase